MIHGLLLFFAPGHPTAQATQLSPPAVAAPASRPRKCRGNSLRFMARVAGNTIGFGALLAGCWFSHQLMQSFLAF